MGCLEQRNMHHRSIQGWNRSRWEARGKHLPPPAKGCLIVQWDAHWIPEPHRISGKCFLLDTTRLCLEALLHLRHDQGLQLGRDQGAPSAGARKCRGRQRKLRRAALPTRQGGDHPIGWGCFVSNIYIRVIINKFVIYIVPRVPGKSSKGLPATSSLSRNWSTPETS